MIVAVASCPQPPLLLPGVTGGVVPEVEKLRASCAAAIDHLAAADLIAVVGGAARTGRWSPLAPSPRLLFAPYGKPEPDETLPLSLAVARELLASVRLPIELHGIDHASPPADCRAYGRGLARHADRIGLLVMADGSARRGPKAPGYADPRALVVDRQIEDALRSGAFERLLGLRPDVADDLLIGGRAAWQVLAGACGSLVRTECHYSDDPFGVWYPVFSARLDSA
ncbi:hypothetical protein [Fodinicola acaciae]|uniref:hypothetical protein n=1 Tax=Fodinicola acaciae TaxID=2681555 RepID=UPI0013D7BD0F|nr:hypothetical protein [Fodinicola acaciae]